MANSPLVNSGRKSWPAYRAVVGPALARPIISGLRAASGGRDREPVPGLTGFHDNVTIAGEGFTLPSLSSLWKRILHLALPSIATFSSATLTGMITLLIVGRLGAYAIAIVGVCNILMYNTWAMFAGINESVSFLVSQNHGEKTMHEANERMQIALVLSACLSLAILVASVFLPGPILALIGTPHALLPAGVPYFRLRLASFCFSILTNSLYAYMRGVGDTRTPMFISLTSSLVLVGLTFGLTYGAMDLPRMGLAGAGVAVVVSECLACLLSLAIFYGPYHRRFHTRQWLLMRFSQVRMMAWESVKLSTMEMSMSLGMVVFTACITRAGITALAANEIALNVLSFGFMPANGFAVAATTTVGSELGANRLPEARRVGLHTVLLGAITMAVYCVLLAIFCAPVAHVYTHDPSVVSLAVSLLRLAAFIELFDGSGIIFAGALRGAGDTTFLFRTSLILNWVIFTPLTLLMTFVWKLGVVGAWISLCTLIVLFGTCNGWRYARLRWESLLSMSARMANSAQAP